MENKEGDELLLSRAWRTGGRTAVGEKPEASEQPNAQSRRNSHASRLHAIAKCSAMKQGGYFGPTCPLMTPAGAEHLRFGRLYVKIPSAYRGLDRLWRKWRSLDHTDGNDAIREHKSHVSCAWP